MDINFLDRRFTHALISNGTLATLARHPRSHAEKINPAPASPTNETPYHPTLLPHKPFPHPAPSIIESKGYFIC
jgi:hypothetical protein